MEKCRRAQMAARPVGMRELTEIAVVPPQIELCPTRHGYLGIFAKYDFKEGTDIYSHASRPVAEDEVILLVTPRGTVPIDIKVHTVRRADGLRDYFGFDSFMNHSCAPNTISVVYPGDAENGRYATQAATDIKAGDEITCNYLLFDWDCDGHSFDCLCGAKECFGRIGGFGNLPFEKQLRLADGLDDPTFARFVASSGERLKPSALSLEGQLRLRKLGL
jgi:hypothetical protein